jgi:hypothetical protein
LSGTVNHVPFRLLRVEADHIAPVTDHDLLDFEVGRDLPVAPGAGQHLLAHFLLLAHPAAQDIREGRRLRLQQRDVLGADHPPVRDDRHVADLKAPPQGRDHRRERGPVVRVARK